MTQSTTIEELLHWTNTEYWQQYLTRYMKWCECFADGTKRDLQKLLSNSAINAWYTKRHDEIEQQAIDVLRPHYQTIKIDILRNIYSEMLVEVFSTYPKPLFETARKLSITNNPPNYDPSAN